MIRFFLLALLPISSYGQAEWAFSIGSVHSDWHGEIVVDENNYVYALGRFYNDIDLDPGVGELIYTSAGSFDFFVQKLDANGDLVWAFALGNADNNEAFEICVNDLGEVFIYGSFDGIMDLDPGIAIVNLGSAGYTSHFLMKLNSDGNLIWAKNLGQDIGAAYRYYFGMQLNAESDIYLTGQYGQTIDFDFGSTTDFVTAMGSTDCFLQKITTDGEYVWTRSFGGPNTDGPRDLVLDGDGAAYITGFYNGSADFDPSVLDHTLISAGDYDTYVLKLDSLGEFIWVKSFGGIYADLYSYSLDVDSEKSVYVTGHFAHPMDFDPGPSSHIETPASGDDCYVFKLDSVGSFKWVNTLNGYYFDEGHEVKCSPSGNVFVAGLFGKTTDFDPGPGVYNLTSLNDFTTDVFVQKLNSDGGFIYAKRIGSPSGESAPTMDITANEEVYLSTSFKQDLILNVGGTNNLFSADTTYWLTDILTLKFGSNVGIQNQESVEGVSIYPNPLSGNTIYFSEKQSDINYQIFDSSGALVQNGTLDGNELAISNTSPGLYVMVLEIDGQSERIRFVIP